MTTELTTGLPTPTPQVAQSLSPQELEEHRAKIAFEVEVILDGYWQTRPNDTLKAGIMAGWMDALDDWTLPQIVYALRKWRDQSPDKKPNPGHILAILKAKRGAQIAARSKHETKGQDPERKPADPETVAAILEQAGITPKRMEGNK